MKGQVSTTDLIFALFLFVLCMLVIYEETTLLLYKIEGGEATAAMLRQAASLGDQLIESPGSPFNWTNATVDYIGLANTQNVIDNRKLSELMTWSAANITDLKDQLGIAEYHFFVRLLDIQGNELLTFGEAPVNVVRRASVPSFVVYNNSVVSFYVILWS